MDVSAGAGEEGTQALSFWIAYSGASLFASPPQVAIQGSQGLLSFTPASQQRGVAHFNVTLSDNGPEGGVRGDLNRSALKSFRVFVRGINQAPLFTLIQNLTTLRDGPRVMINLASNISAGRYCEESQTMHFVVPPQVTVVDSLWPAEGLFSEFNLLLNGTFYFRLAQGRSGLFDIAVTLRDKRRTAFGGVDSTTKSFQLLSLPLSEPELRAQNEVRVPESFATATPYSYPRFCTAFLGNKSLDVALGLNITSVTNAWIFAVLPQVLSDGTLTFKTNVGTSGVSIVNVSVGQTNAHTLTIFVESVNSAPTFEVTPIIPVNQASGYVTIPHAALNINPGSINEARQRVTFSVSYVSSSSLLPSFLVPPSIDEAGSLSFKAASDAHGVATLTIRAGDNGGTSNGGINVSQGHPKMIILQILPLPRVDSVLPCIGPASGGGLVTLYGKHFGSEYARGYASASYKGVAVYIGGARCGSEAVVSDRELRCSVPRGIGMSDVTVNVSDAGLARGGVLHNGYAHALVYYGGALAWSGGSDGNVGFVGVGPRGSVALSGEVSSPYAEASMQLTSLGVSRSITALAVLGGKVYLGKNFLSAGGMSVQYVCAWDGDVVYALGGGADGVVYSVSVYVGRRVVVGGAFTRVFQSAGGTSLASGGLAMWDGESWDRVGGAQISGVVLCSHVNGTRIYVGGRFTSVGVESLTSPSTAMSSLAVYNGGTNSIAGGWGSVGVRVRRGRCNHHNMERRRVRWRDVCERRQCSRGS